MSLIAFSGGQDSINLLILLFKKDSTILWCNHLWKKEDFYLFRHTVQISAIFYQRFFYTIFFSKHFSEQEARKYRYFLFFRILNYSESQFVLTAHTLSDNVETFFIHLFRGSGKFGLHSLQNIQLFYNYDCSHQCSQKFY